jgi:hypothetical protein
VPVIGGSCAFNRPNSVSQVACAKQIPMRIDRIISLGGKCEVAYQSRRAMSSDRAYPFDWWTTPIEAVPKLLATRFEEVFKPENLTKVPSPDRGTVLKSLFGGTTHPHDFRFDEDIVPYDLETISNDLSPKYAFLSNRMFEDCARGTTLFIRQRVWHDPNEKDALEPIVAEILDELRKISPSHRLLLLDYDPAVAGGEAAIQRHVTQHADAKNLGSAQGWQEMFASLPLTLGRTGKLSLADLQWSDPQPPTIAKRIYRRLSLGRAGAKAP